MAEYAYMYVCVFLNTTCIFCIQTFILDAIKSNRLTALHYIHHLYHCALVIILHSQIIDHSSIANKPSLWLALIPRGPAFPSPLHIEILLISHMTSPATHHTVSNSSCERGPTFFQSLPPPLNPSLPQQECQEGQTALIEATGEKTLIVLTADPLSSSALYWRVCWSEGSGEGVSLAWMSLIWAPIKEAFQRTTHAKERHINAAIEQLVGWLVRNGEMEESACHAFILHASIDCTGFEG